MRVSICDICYYETNGIADKKYSASRFKLSYKNNTAEKLTLDACEKHKDFFKVCKNYAEAQTKVHKLYGF